MVRITMTTKKVLMRKKNIMKNLKRLEAFSAPWLSLMIALVVVVVIATKKRMKISKMEENARLKQSLLHQKRILWRTILPMNTRNNDTNNTAATDNNNNNNDD